MSVADEYASDDAKKISFELIRLASTCIDECGCKSEDVSLAMITVGVSVAAGRMQRERAIEQLRGLLATFGDVH